MTTDETADKVRPVLDEYGRAEDAEFFLMLRRKEEDVTFLAVQCSTGGLMEVLVSLVRMLGPASFEHLAAKAKLHALTEPNRAVRNAQGEGDEPGEGGPLRVDLPGDGHIH